MIVLATAHAELPLGDDIVEHWATPADRVHAGHRKRQAAQYHSLLARAGMRALLFSYTGQNEWQFCADARGKLATVDAAGRPGPAISVSHTRGMVACGLARSSALGIDVERHRPRDFDAIAEWGFGPKERSAVRAGRAAAFYRIWTLREAIGKATGEGLALVADRQDYTEGPDEGIWHQRFDHRNWLLAHYRIDGGISLAVAALLKEDEHADMAATVHWVDLNSVERT